MWGEGSLILSNMEDGAGGTSINNSPRLLPLVFYLLAAALVLCCCVVRGPLGCHLALSVPPSP